MTQKISIMEHFGEFCSNGDAGVKFLLDVVQPVIESGKDVIFDLEGVKRMNSSFCNALFGNLFALYGAERFKIMNVKEDLKVMFVAAFEHGKKLKKECEEEQEHRMEASLSLLEKIKSCFLK